MRGILAVVALAALAVVGWIALRGSGDALVGAQPEAVDAVEPEADAGAGAALPPAAAPEAVAPAAAPATSREALAEATPEASAEPEAEEDLLSGTVVLTDVDGAALSAGSGTLTWICWKGRSGSHVEVPVTDGAWSVTLHALGEPEGLQVHELVVDGERVVVDVPQERIPVPEERFVEVRAHRPSGVTLRVIDAATGDDLDGIRLASAGGGHSRGDEHPGPGVESRLVAQGLGSPVELSAAVSSEALDGLRRRGLFVAVDGYAWTPAKVDFDVGGEFLVGLGRGGDLVVTVVGYDPKDRGELRVRAGGRGKPLVSKELRQVEPLRLTGLPAGEVRVAVEVGAWYDEPLALGEAVATIAPGTVADVTLEVEAAPEPEYATASGLLLVPEAWGDDNPHVRMEFLGTALAGFDDYQSVQPAREAEADRPGVRAFRWTFDSMLVGGYELGLSEPAYSIRIDLPAGGREDFVFELPPPVELLVRVVDERTGEDLRTEDELNWNATRPEGVTGGSLERAEYDEELRRYRILAPETEIHLMLWDWGYTPASGNVDLAAGIREHTLRMQRASVIEITLVDGDVPVAFPDGYSGRPVPVEGTQGRVSLSQQGDTRWRFQMSAPGRYRFEVPEVPGFEPAEPLTIDLLEGETSKQVVELQRL